MQVFDEFEGLILKGVGGLYFVESQSHKDDSGKARVFKCSARGIFRKDNIKPLAGDWVRVLPDGDDTGVIVDINERKNFLNRPPVANIDYLMIVSSVAEPVPSTFIIDKLTAFAVFKNIIPVIVISKSDLNPKLAEDLAKIYKKAKIDNFIISSEVEDEFNLLEDFIQTRKIYAFTGNSGTGKSTIINRLDPRLSLETGEISEKLGRGRHTTRTIELFHFRSGFLVDTPGFSSLNIDREDALLKEDLSDCFLDFLPYSQECKFNACSHIGIKGCAVLDALEKGLIAESRYKSYQLMYEEIKDIKAWELR